MALSKEKKQQHIDALVEKIKAASSVAFFTYGGTTVAQQTALRKALREQGAEMKVAKKTLVKIAVKEAGIEGELSDEAMEGQVAVAFSNEEPTVGPQAVKKLSKDIEQISLKGGIFEGKTLSVAEVKELADLPSKEVLIGKLLGSMQAPLSGFVGVGNNIVSGFVRVLDGHRENLEKTA